MRSLLKPEGSSGGDCASESSICNSNSSNGRRERDSSISCSSSSSSSNNFQQDDDDTEAETDNEAEVVMGELQIVDEEEPIVPHHHHHHQQMQKRKAKQHQQVRGSSSSSFSSSSSSSSGRLRTSTSNVERGHQGQRRRSYSPSLNEASERADIEGDADDEDHIVINVTQPRNIRKKKSSQPVSTIATASSPGRSSSPTYSSQLTSSSKTDGASVSMGTKTSSSSSSSVPSSVSTAPTPLAPSVVRSAPLRNTNDSKHHHSSQTVSPLARAKPGATIITSAMPVSGSYKPLAIKVPPLHTSISQSTTPHGPHYVVPAATTLPSHPNTGTQLIAHTTGPFVTPSHNPYEPPCDACVDPSHHLHSPAVKKLPAGYPPPSGTPTSGVAYVPGGLSVEQFAQYYAVTQQLLSHHQHHHQHHHQALLSHGHHHPPTTAVQFPLTPHSAGQFSFIALPAGTPLPPGINVNINPTAGIPTYSYSASIGHPPSHTGPVHIPAGHLSSSPYAPIHSLPASASPSTSTAIDSQYILSNGIVHHSSHPHLIQHSLPSVVSAPIPAVKAEYVHGRDNINGGSGTANPKHQRKQDTSRLSPPLPSSASSSSSTSETTLQNGTVPKGNQDAHNSLNGITASGKKREREGTREASHGAATKNELSPTKKIKIEPSTEHDVEIDMIEVEHREQETPEEKDEERLPKKEKISKILKQKLKESASASSPRYSYSAPSSPSFGSSVQTAKLSRSPDERLRHSHDYGDPSTSDSELHEMAMDQM